MAVSIELQKPLWKEKKKENDGWEGMESYKEDKEKINMKIQRRKRKKRD